MSKLGWVAYSVIVIIMLVVSFTESFYIGFALIVGLVLGVWGGAEFPWEEFKGL
jgi:Na+/phosphate symporter